MIDYFNKINIVSGCKTIFLDITNLYICIPKNRNIKNTKNT